MSTQITSRSRAVVAERSNGICEICGQARAVEMSHRRPKGMGGTSITGRHLPSWLIHACSDCHRGPGGVESDRTRALTNGWLLGPMDDASRTPVLLVTMYGRGWWLLDDDGSYLNAA